MALEPKVLLLDEPSAGLNRDAREDLARFILRIKHETGIPMIWVEHDMQMVADLSDRLYVLNYGEYLTDGTPEEVLSNSKVIAAYLGGSKHAATIPQQNAAARTQTLRGPALGLPGEPALTVPQRLLNAARERGRATVAPAPYKRDNRRIDVAKLPALPRR